MAETIERTSSQSAEKFIFPSPSPATDEEIIAYLRRHSKIAEIAASAEREALILNICEQLGIAVSEAELQAAGDAFRQQHKLIGASATLAWLSQQRIAVEDWAQGIRVELLEKKLKEHLFSASVDNHYLKNRNDYRRVAISQILVDNLTDALKIVQALREENISFCALALEYSKGKISREKGGFAGTHFISQLMAEIAQAIDEAQAGDVIGPIETQLGYHIIKVEKWFPTQLSESVREEIFSSLFQSWLREQGYPSNFKL